MTGDAVTPERAFQLLSDPTRVGILRALWAAEDAPGFSELRSRVGTDDSGRFNYHLGELRGHYVAKGEDGYALTQAGREVVRAVLAGSLTEQPETGPAPIDGRCVDCGGGLTVRYDGHAVVACADCGETVMWNEFPPAGLEGRDAGAVARAFDRWTRSRFHLAMAGVCPSCAARTSVEVLAADDGEGGRSTLHRCGNCGYEARVPLFGHVVRHPAVVSFLHDRGVDVAGLPYWELQALAREFEETVVSEDPWAAEVVVPGEGRTLRLTLDADLTVVAADVSGD